MPKNFFLRLPASDPALLFGRDGDFGEKFRRERKDIGHGFLVFDNREPEVQILFIYTRPGV